ncbi:beta-xylosidase [Microdochium trichocladiopsis]|uniref:Beta-xylosidase n=1 Tax=Microdochium trichocladiopsis TaxID=1682393 RepID=A0A9P9BRE6_9PEZI|nr:beta-xylosidase [Microdochium trichocladiopsis]KAH7032725.1 beta-xylosidase [Microdochium trichocladiopsis]
MLTGVLGATLAAAQTLPAPAGWPVFWYKGIITDPATSIYNPTNEFIFPSVFHAGRWLANPLAEWYIYYAPHDDPGGISLRYSNSLEGPWTEHPGNPVISRTWAGRYSVPHVSSPDAIWNLEANGGKGRMIMYFHGSNSVTRWAYSDDGIKFGYGGEAVTNAMGGPNVVESSYARVFRHPNAGAAGSKYKYGMFYMGNERDNRRRIRLAESVDGKVWTVSPDYVVAPGPEEGQNVSGGELWNWNGQHYILYHASSGKIYARTIDKTLRRVGATPIVLYSGKGDSSGDRVASPVVVTRNGLTYLFYEKGTRLGATIAWAKMAAQ